MSEATQQPDFEEERQSWSKELARMQDSYLAKVAELRSSREGAILDAIKACRGEMVETPDNDDDETYNRAIDHCVEAILGVA